MKCEWFTHLQTILTIPKELHMVVYSICKRYHHMKTTIHHICLSIFQNLIVFWQFLKCFLIIKNDESKVYMVKTNSIQCYIIFSMIDFSSYIIEICVTSHTNILFAWESFIYTSRKALNSWTWFCKTIPMISTTL
jgi:hypothetical protein